MSEGSFELRSSRAGARSFVSEFATSVRLSTNKTVASPNATNNAVPKPIATGIVPAEATVAAPSAAVATPTATRRAVPAPIAMAMSSPLSITGCHASPIFCSPSPIAHISIKNNPVAIPISPRTAVPTAILAAIEPPPFTVALPNAYVTTPTATRSAVPAPNALSTVAPVPFLLTIGSQASATAFNSIPSNAIEPTIINAARATSPIITTANPIFTTSVSNFCVRVLVAVLIPPVAFPTVSVAVVRFFILLAVSSSVLAESATVLKFFNMSIKPITDSIAPIANETQSTTSQSPVLMACMMFLISVITPVNP